jgi:integrase
LEHWLTEIKAHDGTRPSTLRRYREVVDNHLVPVLGNIRLDKLTPADVEHLLSTRRKAVAPATLLKIHAVLRVALADAERRDLIPRNVARAVKGPRLATAERRALTVEEARRLLAVAAGYPYEAIFVLGLVMGLRERPLGCAGTTSTSRHGPCGSRERCSAYAVHSRWSRRRPVRQGGRFRSPHWPQGR